MLVLCLNPSEPVGPNDRPRSSSIAKFVLNAGDTTVLFKGSDVDALYHDINLIFNPALHSIMIGKDIILKFKYS